MPFALITLLSHIFVYYTFYSVFCLLLISTFNKKKTYHFQEPSFFAFLYSKKDISKNGYMLSFTVNEKFAQLSKPQPVLALRGF